MISGVVGDMLSKEKSCGSSLLKDSLTGVMSRSNSKKIERHDTIRVSGIGGWCPRMFALARFHDIELTDTVKPPLSWIFSIGSAYHYQMQNELLPKLGDIFQGWWLGLDGLFAGDKVKDKPGLERLWRSKPVCDYDLSYHEMEFMCDGITGHTDGVLVWPDKTEILELKTISSYGFDSVNPMLGGTPKIEHIWQASLYAYFAGLEHFRLVYIRKGDGKWPSDIAEHECVLDKDVVDKLLTLGRECIRVIRMDEVTETDIPVKMCDSKTCTRAKRCGVKKLCFA